MRRRAAIARAADALLALWRRAAAPARQNAGARRGGRRRIAPAAALQAGGLGEGRQGGAGVGRQGGADGMGCWRKGPAMYECGFDTMAESLSEGRGRPPAAGRRCATRLKEGMTAGPLIQFILWKRKPLLQAAQQVQGMHAVSRGF